MRRCAVDARKSRPHCGQRLTSVVSDRRHVLVPFAALSATYFAHIGFFNPYLPLWLKDSGFSLLAIGMLTAIQSATRIFAPYAWGALSDHTGERVKWLRLGATVALLASFGLWIPGSFAWVALVLVVMFTHTSGMMPISEAAMAHLVSRDGEFDAKRYGRVRLWGSLGFFITVMLAGVWFEYFGIQHFPAWTVVTLASVVACVWALPNLKEEADASSVYTSKRLVWPVLKQPLVQWLFASVFFHVLAHMAVYFFLSLYLDALGYSKTVIGLLWGASVLVEIVWFFTQSRWLPWLPLSSWLCVAALLTFIRMGFTAAGADYWPVLLLAQLLHAVTFAAHHSVCIHLISQHFPAALRGRGQALYSLIAYGLTGVVGGLAGGALIEHWGLASIFWGAMGSAMVATWCAYKLNQLAQ